MNDFFIFSKFSVIWTEKCDEPVRRRRALFSFLVGRRKMVADLRIRLRIGGCGTKKFKYQADIQKEF